MHDNKNGITAPPPPPQQQQQHRHTSHETMINRLNPRGYHMHHQV
jgi:hypothetical protein